MHVRGWLRCAGLVLATAGCVASTDAGGTKGREDAIPIAGKADAFGTPTDHGPLSFGVANGATFESGARFHSWQFGLGDQASLDVWTEASDPNLDTVMYLYARQPDDTWGAYVARNDDRNGSSLASRISIDLEAGTYRVLVKAYKTAMWGPFDVRGMCSGPGCAPLEGGPETTIALADETSYGPACRSRLGALLARTWAGDARKTVNPEERDALGGLEAESVRLYLAYFDTPFGESDLSIVMRSFEGGGRLIDVEEEGSDEMMVTFAWDDADDLVMFFHDEQTASAHWFCGDGAPGTVAEPDTECMIELLRGMEHDPDSERLEEFAGSVRTALDRETNTAIRAAITSFQTASELFPSDDIVCNSATWGSPEETPGAPFARVDLAAEDVPWAIYYVSATRVLLQDGPAEGPSLVCAPH